MTDPAAARRTGYLLFATVAVAVAVAKVVGAENVYEPSRFLSPSADAYGPGAAREAELNFKPWPATRPAPTPTFGSNDRSRWATIRALAEQGTYVIGTRENHTSPDAYTDTGIVFEDGFQSIDKILNPDTGKFYSSKPPLMPTVLAGEYWLLMKAFGWSMDRDRWWVVATILLTVNVLPFAVYLWLLARLIEQYGTTDFGRLFAFTVAAVGTFLTTFSVALNNHSPAAYCTLFAIYPLLRKRDGEPDGGAVFASGFFAALAAALELPALALLAGLFVPLLIARPRLAVLYFLPGAAVVLAAHFACNYAAMGEFLPAYEKFDTPWYRYPGSHWSKFQLENARGIDFIKEPQSVYAFHLLLGHHGWFSLTPVWLLAAVGLLGLGWKAGPEVSAGLAKPGRGKWPWTPAMVAALTVVITVVLFSFYIFVAPHRNYGGGTSGLRWLFWVTPLWVLGLVPAADRLGRSSAGQVLAAGALGMSVLSVFYPAWNPWRSPWIMQLLQTLGVLGY